MSSPNPRLCPVPIQEIIQRYATEGVRPDRFLHAILANDLRGAIGTANDSELPLLKHIVCYCHWEIPSVCWGSHEKVKDHLEKFAKTRLVT